MDDYRCSVCEPLERLTFLIVKLRHLMAHYHDQEHRDRRPWHQCLRSPCVDVRALLAATDKKGDV